jgi:hypothetical protein
LGRSPDWQVLVAVLRRHQMVQEGNRNDLYRPNNEITDAGLMMRRQSYYQGYMDALQFVIRLRALMDQAVPMPNVRGGRTDGQSR